MDFGNLLHAAKRNSDKKTEVKYYSTKFEPPKKESKEKKLSANIQKFLAKKEAEEKQQNEIRRKQRDELIAKRTPTAQRKIEKMLKVIKSANKSVLDDAVDHDNTAVTLQGPSQPDEDDYGYVSQEASLYYNKIMEKYQSNPEEKKFSSSGHRQSLNKDQLLNTKNRVREAINRAHDEESLPHRKPRQSKQHGDTYSAEAEREYEEKKSNEVKKVVKNNRPPPPKLDFNQLLKLAEQRQFEPVQVEVPVATKEPERLMSKKEKREFEERQAFHEAREIRLKNRDNPSSSKVPTTPVPSAAPKSTMPNGRIPKLNGAPKTDKPAPAPMNNGRIPKLGQATMKQQPPSAPAKADMKRPAAAPASSHSSSSAKLSNKNAPSSSSSMKHQQPQQSHSSSTQKTNNSDSLKSANRLKQNPGKSKENIGRDVQARSGSSGGAAATSSRSAPAMQNGRSPNVPNGRNVSLAKKPMTADPKGRQMPPPNAKTKMPADGKTRQFPPADVKTRQFPPADVKTRQFPPADVKTRQFPPADVKTRQFPPADVRRKPQQLQVKKRRILDDDDDSEYDSEMDDFIDDGPEEEDYSKYIKEIFGYDKSKFRNEQYDDREMESSFAQVMREEHLSKKIGLMEDLEDMRQEALEKKMKAAKKKRKLNG